MAPGILLHENGNGNHEEWSSQPQVSINADQTKEVTVNVSEKVATEDQLPQRHPSTGVDVLIVGAGMGGLMSALECWRKGHNIVGVVERNDGPVNKIGRAHV